MKHIFLILTTFFLFFERGEAQFDTSKGPYGSTIYSMAFPTTNSILAGTQERLYRWDGTKWTQASLLSCCYSLPFQGGFKPIASNGSVVLYMDGNSFTGTYWLSTNGGVSFSNPAMSGIPYSQSTSISTIVTDTNGNFLAGSVRLTGSTTGGGVWKSTNNGSSWSLLGNQSSIGLDTTLVSSIVLKGNTIFVGTFLTGKLFRSLNNGNSWERLTNGIETYNIISLATNESGTLFAGTGTGNGTPSGGKGVLRSTDNGDTWTQTSLSTHYIFNIVYKNNVLLAGSRSDNGGLFRSTNNGSTWSAANTGLSDAPNGLDIYSLGVDPNGNFFAGTLVDGIFKSTDQGLTWNQVGTPTRIRDVTTKVNGSIFVTEYNGPMYRTTNNGNSWKRANVSGRTTGVGIAPNGTVFLGSESGYGLFQSTDEIIWNQVSSYTGPDVYAITVTSTGTILLGTGYGPDGVLYRSTDNGQTWNGVYNAVTTITTITLSTSNKNLGYIFAANATTNGGILRSTDNGVSWVPKGLSNVGIRTITINSKGDIFVGSDAGIYKSKNNGDTWTGPSTAKSLSTGPIYVLTLAVNEADELFAGTGGNGIYRSTDDGDTWESFDGTFQKNTAVDLSVVSSLSIDTAGYMFAGTNEGVAKTLQTTLPSPHPEFSNETTALDFGSLHTGTPKTDTVTITNTGFRATLHISNIHSDNGMFTVTPSSATILVNENKQFLVTFTPNVMGNVIGNIVFTHDAPNSPDTVAVSGIGLASLFTSSVPSLNFGNVRTGTIKKDSVTITNTGTANLVISSVATLDGKVSIDPAGDTLVPSEAGKFYITFSPVVSGVISDHVVFTHDAMTSPDTVDISGTGTAPIFSVSSSLVAFGNVVVGSSKMDSAIITNTGSASMEITLVSSNNARYSVNPSNATLAPQESKAFHITFSPLTTGMINGIITFTHDASGSPDSVMVSGMGIAPSITLSQSTIGFGTIHKNTTKTDSVIIENTGTAPLHIVLALNQFGNLPNETTSAEYKTNWFQISPSSATIAPGEIKTIFVTFVPQSVGEKNALVIISHDATGSPDTISVSGIGGEPLFDIQSIGETLDFGNVALGSTKHDTLILVNNGNMALVINSVIATSEAITITRGSDTIPAETQGTVILIFSAHSLEPLNALLIFTHNASGSPDTLALQGMVYDTMMFRTIKADGSLSQKAIKLKVKKGVLINTPNIGTVVEAEFKKLGKKSLITLGIPQTDKNRAKQFAWLAYGSSSDLGKLYTAPHDSPAYPLDSNRTKTKHKKLFKAIKADRKGYNNPAWEQGMVFRLNLLASRDSVTPYGLQNLLLDTDYVFLGRNLKGMTLWNISGYLDTTMTYWDSLGLNTQSTYNELRGLIGILKRINDGFSAHLDTLNYKVDNNSIVQGKNPYAVTLSGVKTPTDARIVKRNLIGKNEENLYTIHEDEPEKIALFQNYPNPFNPTTTISFELPNEMTITLAVYNILGQKVNTLIHAQSYEAGLQTITFDASGLSSGVYFYRLSSDAISFFSQRKMILMK